MNVIAWAEIALFLRLSHIKIKLVKLYLIESPQLPVRRFFCILILLLFLIPLIGPLEGGGGGGGGR